MHLGNVGKFDFFALVDALVAGAVLLSVAQFIVTYVALYGMGLSSALYSEFMRESVNWRREYARFAAQSLVGGATFQDFDKNRSGTLDRAEIYKYLSNTFNEILTKAQIACLTDFLMRHGEIDADLSKGRLDSVGFASRRLTAVLAFSCRMLRSAPSTWKNGWIFSRKKKSKSVH